MAVKTDKRASNLFIAGGYCLVAIIILFNYLGQSDSKDREKVESITVATQGASSQIGADALSSQLEEEKRINLEMREMIRRLQGAIGNQTVPLETAGAVEPVEPVEIAAVAQSIFQIPEIKQHIIEDFAKKRSNPFIPGKNPFVAARSSEDPASVGALDNALLPSLQCDPRLPFVITGANSKSGYFANF